MRGGKSAALAGAPLILGMALSGCIPAGRAPGNYRPDPNSARPPRSEPPRQSRPSGVPAAPPAWEARPVTADARTVQPSHRTVRRGDTLSGIAENTGASTRAIARANGLVPPYTIRAGQQLTIPGGRYHRVSAGDTGIAIARAYGVPWSQVVAANDLDPPYILRTGQRILIPRTAPLTVAERAAAFHLDIEDIVTGGEPAIAENERPARATTSAKRVLPSTAAVKPPARLKGEFQWPLDGKLVNTFGPGDSGERHDGVVIAAPLDTPVMAAADGVVVYAGDRVPELGGIVILKHGDDYSSVYGHASKLLVQRGQSVKRGQTIALSGDTGRVDQPELLFEIRKGRTPVDPQTKLPPR